MRIALNAQKLSFARAYQAGGISRYIFELLSQLRQISSPHRFEAFAPLVAPDTSLAPTQKFRLTPTGKATEHPLARILWEQIVLPARTGDDVGAAYVRAAAGVEDPLATTLDDDLPIWKHAELGFVHVVDRTREAGYR